ncbi:MAG: prepilin peptidase [Cyanobium sp.]|jgi:leader peptidase (prepilin peptidase)/N-methyltransferase|nr:prepilin peptidase [Synechococcaceae cyanobacterium]
MLAELASQAPLALVLALLGACFGSFLNLVAWRLPRQESIVRPPSHCTHCGTRLSWHENLPLLGWFLLRGRCRHCLRPIASRYVLVEWLVAGLGMLTLVARPAGLGPAADPLLVVLAGWLLIGWLIPLVLIDLDQLWLPEPLCRWGLLCGLAVTALVGGLQGTASGSRLLLEHLLAAALGLLGFEATSWLAARLFGRPALGLGDAKLAALIGAWLGPLGLGLAVAVAVVSGALVGLLGRLSGRLSRQQAIPFGPFLGLGALCLWWLGPAPLLRLLALG